MANRFWVGGTADWDGTAGTKWSTTSGGAGGAAIPSSSDDVFFDASSGSGIITVQSGQSPKSVDFTGFTGTFAGSATLQILQAITLGTGMTFSFSGTIDFASGSGAVSITSNGITFLCNLTFDDANTTWTLADNLTCTGSIDFAQGALDANNKNITCASFSSSNINTRSITMGSGTWTITSAINPIWDLSTSTGLTLNASTSTIKLTGGAGTKNFNGGSLTYYNYWNATTGAGSVEIAGNNTFNDIKINAGRTQIFNNAQTQTVTTFTAIGTPGAGVITLQGDAGVATLSDSSGTNNVQYCTISFLTATGGATWNALNSTDAGNNTGWNFTTPPIATSGNFLSLL